MDVVKISLIGIAAIIPAIILKNVKSEYSLMIALAALLVIFVFAIAKIRVIVDSVQNLLSGINIESKYIVIILKMLGITYVAEFSSAICKDAGYGSIAGQIEIFSKLALLITGIPIINALITMIGESI